MQLAKRNSVALHGSYYGHNFGDLLLLSIFAKWVREADPSASVVCPLASSAVAPLIGADNWGLQAFQASRGIIFAGGGYLGEPPQGVRKWSARNFFRHNVIGHAAELQRKPIAFIGVGVGPLSAPWMRASVRRLCKRARVVAVRDEESEASLSAWGVPRGRISLVADAAMTLGKDDVPFAEAESVRRELRSSNMDEGRLLGIHLPFVAQSGGDSATVLAASVTFARARGFSGVVLLRDDLPQNGGDYASWARATLERAGAGGMPVLDLPYKGVWNLMAQISELALIVTNKLHVGIVANALRVPVVAVPTHTKTERFYRQIGAGHLCLTQEAQVTYRSVQDTCEAALVHGGRVPGEVRVRAFKNRSLVHEFVQGLM